MRVWILLILAALETGCAGAFATGPVSNAEARRVPPGRVIDGRLMHPTAGSAEVTIKRDSGFGGSACAIRLFLSGGPVADLRPAEKVTLFLAGGDYVVSVEPTGICGGGMREVQVSVKPSQRLNLRIRREGNGELSLHPTAF